ncbi:MAG: hypothetical protein FJ304_27600, partial [Planctomycetes bacterium]|nr:hypothetical protein [Planctomycetota bacterium]
MRHMFLVMVGWLCSAFPVQAQDFVLREHLGRTWSHELVSFPLTRSQLEAVRQGAQVVGPKDEPIPSQLITDGKAARLAFQVTLSPLASQSYRLDKSAKPKAGDLEVQEKPDRWLIGNARVGIALRKKLQAGEAP